MKAILFALTSLVSLNSWAFDYPAKNCEVFIDKAVQFKYQDQRMKSQGVVFFLKVLTDRLDSKIKSVVFYGSADGYAGKTKVNYPLKPFAGASDYFEIALQTFGSDADVGSGSSNYSGAFYVETEKGTKYWVNAANDWNFSIDTRLSDSLKGKYNPGAVSWSPRDYSMNDYPKTGDVESPSAESYLNPSACR